MVGAMGDPTGLSGAVTGYFVGKLLNLVIEETKNTLYYQRYCNALGDLLQNIQPLVLGAERGLEAAAGQPRDHHTDTNETVSTGGPGAVKKWLGDMERVLEEAHAIVLQCKTTSRYNLVSRNIMARKILNITKQIETTSTIQAPLAAINIGAETLEAVRANNRLLAGLTAQLQLDLNAKAVGGTTQVILQIEGMQPAQAFQEIRSRTDTFAASVYGESSYASSSQENDHEDEQSSYTLRPVPEKTFGMDVPSRKLQDLLLGEITNMKWVGVYGKGGIGKTLLTNQAFNSKAVQDHFQKNSFWLTVGRKPSIQRLQNKLCADLKLRTAIMESHEETKTRLSNKLRGKKVLLVLDDVWEDDGISVLNWLDVTSGWDTGSKILVTTRNIEVLEKKHAQDSTMKMERLSDYDSWELFCEFAFAGVDNVPPTLNQLALAFNSTDRKSGCRLRPLEPLLPTNGSSMQSTSFCDDHLCGTSVNLECLQGIVGGRAVADECKGLPLALKVIAGAQAGQRSTEQWQRALKKLRDAEVLNTDHEVQLYKRLQLSYDSLESLEPAVRHRHRLQKCFIFFAGYPEDRDVDVEKLVSLWAGEKLLEADFDDTDNDPSLDGKYLLGLLIGRSLIDLQTAQWSDSVNSHQLKCRVHDVLRDLARHLIHTKAAPIDCLFKAGEELKEFPDKWLTKATSPSILGARLGDRPRHLTSDATHLSLNDNMLESLPTKLQAPKLEVLLLANNWTTRSRTRLVIPPGFLESFSNLKVLDLERTLIDLLPESVGNLKNLMYLDLSFTGLLKLPRGLRKLQKLETLSLQNCRRLQPWPFDISSLTSLSSLNTRGCGNLWNSELGSRQMFWTHHDSLESLCSLTALRNLSISGHHEHLPSKMSSLVNLRHLSLYLGNLKKLPSELHSTGGSQLSKLQYFSLDNCRALSELPVWMDSLAQLASLNLVLCTKLTCLPNLHKLQELRKLDLSCCTGLQELPAGFASTGAFPALKELCMQCCEGLREFPAIEEGAFPELMILRFTGCVFETLPGSLSLLPELVTLDLNLCKRLKTLDDCFHLSAERHTTDQASERHQSVPYFTKLQDLGLKEVPLNNLPCGLAACPALKTIDLSNTHDVSIPESLRSLQAEGKVMIKTTSPRH